MPQRIDPSEIATKEQFGQRLTLLRERAGLSTRDLAREAGLPLATLAGYLSGRHLPQAGSRKQMLKVLAVCGVIGEAADDWMDAVGRARRADRRRAPGRLSAP